MADTTTSACKEVLSAADAASLFGTNERRARIRYHRLARLVHPDAAGGSEEAMARLNALWDEYNGERPATKVGKGNNRRPKEVTRNGSYAIFEEDGHILAVERGAGGNLGPIVAPHDLECALKGSPVGLFEPTEAKFVAQKDGWHASYVCKGTPEAPILLPPLVGMLPNGKFEPEDLAWLSKRAIFLALALESAGLGLKRKPCECLAVIPNAHMLLVMPWELVEAAADDRIRRDVLSSYLEAVAGAVGSDEKSRRLMRFVTGASLEDVTPANTLMCEYDELLDDLFGGRRYHRMVLDDERQSCKGAH